MVYVVPQIWFRSVRPKPRAPRRTSIEIQQLLAAYLVRTRLVTEVIGGAKAIDDCDEELVGCDARLKGEKADDLAVTDGEVFDLLLGGGGDGESDGGEVGFAGGVDFDSGLE